MKIKIYPIAIGLSIALMAAVFSRRVEITISNNSNLPNNLPRTATVIPPATTAAPNKVIPVKSKPTPIPVEPEELNNASSIPTNVEATGVLRVSNRSEHPVRVALLAKRETEKSYSKPAHWDFAPGEGSGKGLMLSLPQTKLKVKQGDILVVFAQDGSRRYWGPYVAGETASPAWNNKTGEWQLILSP
ncbi:hypothetical protein [Tychonema sp. BBK16]|uniref:hypothetical protein n=1 Tax=Tychonema sp. BBK16 TaxID=2699888 RepID=UPI001F2C2A5D|nr:hypothetical protein [Tychonema sp. BBK16]MCF6374449.1 hypothetical protein [Tychonema sp. BBK16]